MDVQRYARAFRSLRETPIRRSWAGPNSIAEFGLGVVLADKLHCSYTARMSRLHFEWDDRKAAANARKHGVSFDEAKSVFVDERAKLIDDPDHSEDEDRFVLLGLSSALRLLLVCHCYRSESNVIRIISARKATAKESNSYP